MTREEKSSIIEDLKLQFAAHNHFYITDSSSLSVEQVNNFRRICFQKGVEYKVIKNTLIRKALDTLDADYSSFNNGVLKGFSGIIFSKESGKLPAEVLKEFRGKAGKKPLLKAASIDSCIYIGDENLDALTKLKSKEELVGDIIALLQSPAKNVISALKSAPNTLAGILKTLSEK
jgi:large subunit ribosomal protein L10